MADVVVALDMVEVAGFFDARNLIDIAQIAPEIWIIHDATQVAFEMYVINRVEAK